MNLFEKLNRLDDSLVESKRVVKKKKLTEGIYTYQTYVEKQPGEKQPSKSLTYGNHFIMSRSPYRKERFGADWKRHINKIIEWCQENNQGLIRSTHDFRLDNFGKNLNSPEAFIAAIEHGIETGEYELMLTEAVKDADRREEFLKSCFTKWEILDLAEAHDDFTGRTYEEAFDYVLNNWDNFYFEDEYESFCEDELEDKIEEMLTEGISKGSLIRWLKDKAVQDISTDEFNTLVNNLWNVIEKENAERKFYKRGYKSIEEVDVPQLIDSSDNPVHDIGYRLLGWSAYDDDIDEQLTESTEQYELSTLVKDSINHLVNDLGKDAMADDFGDDVCADLENNYNIYVPQDPVKYADWCGAVMSEVSRQLNNKDELTEGNNVSSQLPAAIDEFLQDIAQMYGTITYKDIMEHEYTEEDLKKLKNYRRRFKAEIPYEGDEEANAILKNIAEQIALIVKR